MRSNVQGNYRTTLHNKMRAYDNLPSAIRVRLGQMPRSYAPQRVLTAYRKRLNAGMWPSEAQASIIEALDRTEKRAIEEHYYRLDRTIATGIDYHAQVLSGARKAKSWNSVNAVGNHFLDGVT